MTGYLYILHCRDGSYYVGSTNNLEARLYAHRNPDGGSFYTSVRLPVELVYSEEFVSLHDAFLAERQVKGWSRAKKEALIRRDYDALPALSWSTARKQEYVLRQAQDAGERRWPSGQSVMHLETQEQSGVEARTVPPEASHYV